jgi:phosphoenolpyruvate synthase/pyruvate phosphate dikinase
MFRLGLPVPAGFVITTETCIDFFHEDDKVGTFSTKALGSSLIEQYTKAIHELGEHLFN